MAQTLPPTYPADVWATATPAEVGMDAEKLRLAREYALSRHGSGLVARFGYKVDEWGSQTLRVPVFSVTKGIGAILLGRMIDANEVQLSERAITYHSGFGNPPASNLDRPIGTVTIEQLATHSSGFEKVVYAEPQNGTPFGGRLRQDPGAFFLYSDAGANWLAETLGVRKGGDLLQVLTTDILTPLQLTAGSGAGGDLVWRTPALRPTVNGSIPRREFNSGISMNVDAMARLALLLARNGEWSGGNRILSADFVNRIRQPAQIIQGLEVRDAQGNTDPNFDPNAPAHHGLFWWNNADGAIPNVPTDAHWTWGLGDHLIVVIPSLDLVAARTSSQTPHDGSNEETGRFLPNTWHTDPQCLETWCAHYEILAPFIGNLVAAVSGGGTPGAPTVSLTASATSVAAGSPVTLTWSSTNASSCTASNGWTGTKATSGTESVTVSANATYVLECTGAGGTASQNVAVGVTTPPPPPPPPPADEGGGGGGALEWWLLGALLVTSTGALRKRRRQRS